MSKNNELVSALEDEIRAARATIKSLTKIIEELSKHNSTNTTIIKERIPYYSQPYWWNGNTWFYTSPTIVSMTNSSGTIYDANYVFPNRDDDDGDGISVSNVA